MAPGGGLWTDSWPDSTLGDELAPDADLGYMLVSAIGQAIHGVDKEGLVEGGAYHSSGIVIGLRQTPKVATNRNLVFYDYRSDYGVLYDPATGEIVEGTPAS